MARTARKRHMRHSQYDRTERSKRLRAFLAERSTTLAGTGTNISFTVSAGTITAGSHGLALGDGPFLLVADTDAVAPTPLDESTLYWIASAPDANTITLTSVRGGDPITLTDDGSPGTGAGLSIVKAESDPAIYEYLRQNAPELVRDATDVDTL